MKGGVRASDAPLPVQRLSVVNACGNRARYACRRVARVLVLVLVLVLVAAACGPAVGVDGSGGDGSGEGDAASTAASEAGASSGADASSGLPSAVCGDGSVAEREACDDGNADELDGCDSQCRVTGIELWQVFLPPLSACPRLAALDDGGVALLGNEQFVPDASIPHVLVLEGDGNVRWTFQGGHSQFDVASDLVAEPGGFVVVGRGDSAPDGSVGWMQRWTADGVVDAEVFLGTDELGDQISNIERRDAASYWIVGADGLGPRSLLFRGFDDPPTSATSLLVDAFDIQLASGPAGGAYVTADADAGTLTRVDREGVVIWSMQYTAPIDSVPYTLGLASTASGDAIVSGTDQGEPDAQWIRRFGPDGSELWRVPVEVGDIPSADEPLHVTVDGADDIVVAGWSRKDTGNGGFLAKYDGDGVERWRSIWRAQAGLNVRPCDVVATSEGLILVAGSDFATGQEPDAYWVRAYAP